MKKRDVNYERTRRLAALPGLWEEAPGRNNNSFLTHSTPPSLMLTLDYWLCLGASWDRAWPGQLNLFQGLQ